MSSDKIIDHLFRHEYGKMVSSLTRLYGVDNLSLIEDAVQDTFSKALLYFRTKPLPDNLHAWLRTAVKNRAVDLFRKAATTRKYDQYSGSGFMSMSEVFSDQEIEDNQLRLLFAICHPELKPKDQIIFALKTFSGFSLTEISNALLIDIENCKKTLLRARNKVKEKKLDFRVPAGSDLQSRLKVVHLAIYLLFNEGFHSSGRTSLVRKDLVAESLRLNGLLVDRFNDSNSRALMALMCFHAARLNAKISDAGSLVKLKYQDRSKWNYDFVWKGHIHMEIAIKGENYSRYHWEAAIAAEYVKPSKFEDTDWVKLEIFYKKLNIQYPSPFNLLNLSVIQNQKGEPEVALETLSMIDLKNLKGKGHLYYSVLAEINVKQDNLESALKNLNLALGLASNDSEINLINDKITYINK